MANDSYYSEDAAPPSPDGDGTMDSEGADDQKDASDEKEEGSEDTAESTIIPKSMLAGKTFNVGDEVVLKIVRMDGDEIQVQYATGKGDDEGDGKVENRMAKYADKE
jgi:hypothetical protein